MFTKYKTDINIALEAFVKEADSLLSIKRSSGLLYDGIKDFLLRPGKRIRAILFILSYLGYSSTKRISYKKLVKCSLSFELLHSFLLIHDDIIDKSDLRRGKPSLHNFFNQKLHLDKKDCFGQDLGIVAGDIIFALAIKALFSLNAPPARKERALANFTQTAAFTGIGEFIDVVNNKAKIDRIRQKDISLTYTLKTAKYTFESPLVIGAILAGAPIKDISLLSRLGIILGEAFQIQDDLLDIFSSSEKTGKKALSDLSESKKTILIWHTYKVSGEKEKLFIKRFLEKKRKPPKELLEMRCLIERSGTGTYCKNLILARMEESLSLFAGVKMKNKYKLPLTNFINSSFSKTYLLKI
ncbi:MAG: polyprenyl synthetase family protein [Candidatus Omnitrophica bacterium]|nr:polyprenyl synthetase family protein [Candidatus Omnitrophota bacterium]